MEWPTPGAADCVLRMDHDVLTGTPGSSWPCLSGNAWTQEALSWPTESDKRSAAWPFIDQAVLLLLQSS